MTPAEGVYKYATFVLKNKKAVINLINNQGYGSLKYSSPITDVNKIVIENLGDNDFITGMQNIMNEGYSNVAVVDDLVVIIIFCVIAAGAATATIMANNSNARKIRQELIREGYRSQYLKREELDKIAFIERERLQGMFLQAQADYVQVTENEKAKDKKDKEENIVMVLMIGITAVIIAAALIQTKWK
jgi:hypothetical protein|tara:strand:- start:297 stop:860 length:564 start_codon:yes stop_codon:yes gene_type:complete